MQSVTSGRFARGAAQWAWLAVVVGVFTANCSPPESGAVAPTRTEARSPVAAIGTVATVSALATRIATGSGITASGGVLVTPTPLPNVTLPRPGAQPEALGSTVEPSSSATPEPVSGLQPTPPSVPPAEGLRSVLDTQFSPPPEGWPNDPSSTAWFAADGYHLFARFPQRFVAVGAPLDQTLGDVVVTASFRKLDGPPGGGYGLIVRDAEPGQRDGRNQLGHFYVAEVGDQGNLGIWRRDGDHWVDLVPWTRSSAVHGGLAANQVQVRAIGQTLLLVVNGLEAARVEDDALGEGGVGLFVGGDGNLAVASTYQVQVVAPQ